MLPMKWDYCEYCVLSGFCENQCRGHECNSSVKELFRENYKLKRLLEECKNLINECIRSDYKDELCERIDEVLK